SRPRRNIARDFSDGVLAAEVVKFFFPSLVELHSFVPTSSTAQKVANWGHLNRKVLSKLNLRVPEEMIQQLVRSRPGMAEQLLQLLREKIQERQKQRKEGAGQSPCRGSRRAGEGLGPRAAGPGAREWLPVGKGRLGWDLGKEFLPGLQFPDLLCLDPRECPRIHLGLVAGGCPRYSRCSRAFPAFPTFPASPRSPQQSRQRRREDTWTQVRMGGGKGSPKSPTGIFGVSGRGQLCPGR
uniref:Calponin-homology (CH) domain-containing protein n=1 Tax=Cyanistes caeruleus TaxID=156563 RepID=A0A8C0U6U5_CYACU